MITEPPPDSSRIFVRGAPLPFVQAKNYYPAGHPKGRNGRRARLIVLHSMEHPEKPNAAEAVANWFADKNAPRFPAPRASALVCVDNTGAVQCTRLEDAAWGAPPCNGYAYHIELAGYARQTRAEWLDEFSLAMLEHAADVCASLVCEAQIPILFRGPSELLAAPATVRGFTDHASISRAFHKTTHLDPGPGFPWDTFLAMVRASGTTDDSTES